MSTFAHTREVAISKAGELVIEGLPVRVGQHVRVFIIPQSLPPAAGDRERYPLHGTAARYDDPFAPAADPEDREADR